MDLTSRALARMIEGKTPEEIRETFHLPDDLTGMLRLVGACASRSRGRVCNAEEEKLEPLRTATDDPKIRLLNRLYARKRKELQERKMIRDSADAEGKPVSERARGPRAPWPSPPRSLLCRATRARSTSCLILLTVKGNARLHPRPSRRKRKERSVAAKEPPKSKQTTTRLKQTALKRQEAM